MPDVPPPSPLITPDRRRTLQQRYEAALRLMDDPRPDHPRIHELLAECLRADPGNILYLQALVANLRRWGPKPKRSWLAGLFTPANARARVSVSSTGYQILAAAPETLRRDPKNANALRQLAEAAGEAELDQAELFYWHAAIELAPHDTESLRGWARALTRQGRFDEACAAWRKIADVAPDEESAQALADLAPQSTDAERAALAVVPDEAPLETEAAIRLATKWQEQGEFAAADELLTRAQSASGSDLRLFEAREDLQLARARHQQEIARRRAASDAHPRAQRLIVRLAAEANRLEIDIYYLRSERHPGDMSLRLELARRMKRSGNYSGAVTRLEEARRDPQWAAAALLELGECWQHLRQYAKALDFYRQAIRAGEAPAEPLREGEAPAVPPHSRLVAPLYRLGVLAAAMNLPAEARPALARVVAIDPGYKDARERLDKLP
ncbi:MAG: tetratricopeptide repeat protein [Pirellulaceae bacterium]